MSSPTAPGVIRIPVTLDKERHIVLNFRAFRIYKELTGKDAIKGEMPEGIEELSAFLYATLSREDPTLTQELVEDMVGFGNLDLVTAALDQAITAAMPKEGEVPPPTGTAAAAS